MITVELVRNLVEKALCADELFVVEISVGPRNKIKVVLDSDKTVAISDCILISKAVEHNLDRDAEDFSLEVTSAGLGQPLKLLRQYSKYVGKGLEITVENGSKIAGELKKVGSEFIELLEEQHKTKKTKGGTDDTLLHKLALNNIKMAKAIITIR